MTEDEIKISEHAIERYMERSGTKKRTKAENKLKRMLENGKPVELREEYRAATIIKHGFNEATYLRHGGWLLVVCDGTLVTVHLAETRRWR